MKVFMKFRSKSGGRGFTVTELLMVVAVILIIIAIAVPRMLQARIKAKEAAAVSNVRAIQLAESIYANNFPQAGYADNLSKLGSGAGSCDSPTALSACLLDSSLTSGIKGDYVYSLKGDGNTPDMSYTITATPQYMNAGLCTYKSDQSGMMTSQFGSGQTGGLQASSSSGAAVPCN
jgi:type IV pilus assembly protein PilA